MSLPIMSLPNTKGFFITGTDTEVGKTFVTCCLLKTLQANQSLPIYPRKPIASGAIKSANNQLVSEDALFLKNNSLVDEPLNVICPYIFEQPISPARAIKLNNANISLANLINACSTPNDGIRLVEGAGGFYSPLVGGLLNADLAKQLQLPVIIVVANKLGCINQALLTIEAVKNNGLVINSVIVNDISGQADYANFIDIKQLITEPCIHIPFHANKQAVNYASLYDILISKRE